MTDKERIDWLEDKRIDVAAPQIGKGKILYNDEFQWILYIPEEKNHHRMYKRGKTLRQAIDRAMEKEGEG